MSSASVFNPHLLAELRRMKPSTLSVERAEKFTPSFAAISAVKRNIFGTVDHEECRNLVDKELQRAAEKYSELYGFDFVNEIPMPGKSRFVWEPIAETPVSRPLKRNFEPEFDISHLYAEPLLEDVRPVNENNPQDVQKVQIENVKQSLITDFLKSKKSNSTNRLKHLKKMSVTPSPNRTGKISRRTIRS